MSKRRTKTRRPASDAAETDRLRTPRSELESTSSSPPSRQHICGRSRPRVPVRSREDGPIPDNDADPGRHPAGHHSRDRGSDRSESPGIPSTGADAVRAEVRAQQDALHVAVDGLWREAREHGHLEVVVRWLLARVTR